MVSEARSPGDVLPEAMRRHWYNDDDYTPGRHLESLDRVRTALVLVDLINWQADPCGASIQSIREAGAHARADYLTKRCAEVVLPNLTRVLPVARAAGVQVVHARLASRHPAYSDIVPALRPYVAAAAAMEGSWAADVLPELGPEPGDLSVVKPGSGAFTGTALDSLLRRLDINTVIYAGVVTNACVLLSVAAGFDLGYRQYLISDCTGALDERDQQDAERFIDLYLAEVVTAAEVLDALGDPDLEEALA